MKKNTETTKKQTEDPGYTFRWVREAIETLAIALVLAFLFKTFEAEAYEIPTGSMAPTLMGRHKDLNCSECGFRFQISASEEADEGNNGGTSARIAEAAKRGVSPKLPSVVGGTCPQCRFTMYIGPDNTEKKKYPSYKGDRILVCKYLYDLFTPNRWNVTVFRFPGGPQTNYIKRLVGLENETIQIHNGDVFVCPNGGDEFRILRKPAIHLLAMMQMVNDNDYVNPKLLNIRNEKDRWEPAWADETENFGSMPVFVPAINSGDVEEAKPAWIASEDRRSFKADANVSSNQLRWLNYRHIVPSSEDWLYLIQGEMPPNGIENNPQLITDFTAYNTGIVENPVISVNLDAKQLISERTVEINGETKKMYFCKPTPDSIGYNWTGDLAMECKVTVSSPSGILAFRLVKGGIPFICEIDLSNGVATFSISGHENLYTPVQVQTDVNKAGSYNIRYSNIDEQFRLWVGGKEITLPDNGEYDYLCNDLSSPLSRERSPTTFDLTPVSVGSKGADIKVEHLKVFRDIYYIAQNHKFSDLCDLAVGSPFESSLTQTSENRNARILSDSNYWGFFGKTRCAEFKLDEGQFFLLGDNSGKSLDARVWKSLPGGGQYVEKSYMIGRAAVVYWPHGVTIPVINKPWFPNFKDMRVIE
ncbi:MAG: S26 family signal peptidase [Thermoguttaceae bacterium]